MGEIKQTNFRIDSETADKFRSFCEENGLNQAQGFDHLISILEMDKAKAIVPERVTEIEEFERHIKTILSSYLTSLEIAKSTEERVLEQFRSKLDSKDELIIKLQEEIRSFEEKMSAANLELAEYKTRTIAAEATAKDEQAKLAAAQSTIQDKENINLMLSGKLADAEEKIKFYPELTATLSNLKEALAKAEQELKDTKRNAELELSELKRSSELELNELKRSSELELNELKRNSEQELKDTKRDAEIALEEQKRNAELAQERTINALRQEFNQALMESEKTKAAELQALRDKIDTLKDEKATLREKVLTLESELRSRPVAKES